MADISREELAKRAVEMDIPVHMINSLVEYIMVGRPVGHFLTAVLSNDLKEACNRADEENQKRLYEYVAFLYNYTPTTCWGSPDKVITWMSIGGLLGLTKALHDKVEEPESGTA
jgi:hypothetical protein